MKVFDPDKESNENNEDQSENVVPKRKVKGILFFIFLLALGGAYMWFEGHMPGQVDKMLHRAGISTEEQKIPLEPVPTIKTTPEPSELPTESADSSVNGGLLPEGYVAGEENLDDINAQINSFSLDDLGTLDDEELDTGLEGEQEASEEIMQESVQEPEQESGQVHGLLAQSDDPENFVGRNDDSVVQESFVYALASWMVDMYEPAEVSGQAGRLRSSLQSANLRFGHSMEGIAYVGDSLAKGRKEALEYLYTSGMLQALYHLYEDRFFEAIENAANAKGLTTAQKREMYLLYSRQFRGLSGAFIRVLKLPKLPELLDIWYIARNVKLEANSVYTNAVFALDEANEKGSSAQIAEAQELSQQASTVYQEAIIEESSAFDAILDNMKESASASLLDDGTLLYTVLWIERRYDGARDAAEIEAVHEATAQAGAIFLEIANKLETLS